MLSFIPLTSENTVSTLLSISLSLCDTLAQSSPIQRWWCYIELVIATGLYVHVYMNGLSCSDGDRYKSEFHEDMDALAHI